MSNAPLMPKATAVWLVENTSLTFDQIANFCKLHPLEVKGIADGEVAAGIKGHDPITSGQLTREEIATGEENPDHQLKLAVSKVASIIDNKPRSKRYTPKSRREHRPNAILWLLRNHPELKGNLWKITHSLQKGLVDAGFDIGVTDSCVTPVYMNGSIPEATNLIFDLRENYNIFCSMVVYPVVPKGMIILRLIPTAVHTQADVDYTIECFSKIVGKLKSGEYMSDKIASV